ncbi:MAG TPA: sensor histidine kinase [Steroidobacteraceae bacterium]|jgi:two-component system sensor histidine kinase TctE|nr:sensor histidine kinase [Steroidobacteraceae bacterium]
MMTLRRRLLLTLLPALTLLMILGGAADYWVAAVSTRDAYDQALASSTLALAACLRVVDGTLQFDPTIRASAADSGSGPMPDPTLYRIDAGGRLVAGNVALPVAAVRPISGQVAFANRSYKDQALRTASMRVATVAGTALITVAEPQDRRQRTQRLMLYGKLLVDFVELDLTLLLMWTAVYYGLKPLEALSDQAESAQTLNAMYRLDEVHVPGELRSVVVSFNRAVELLQEAAGAQQRFVADAAHQLRTPVAGIMAQLELLVADQRSSAIAPQLRNLQSGIRRLSHTANQLLSLMRADPVSAMQEKFEPVALPDLAETLVLRHLGRADERRIDLGADAKPAQVMGNVWLLEDLLGNLIDNALKYTPDGGRVTVRCYGDDVHAVLEVEDNGPGIPVADRHRVKERFYRSPASPGTGAGLGLAIVEEIARLHRADFTISPAVHDAVHELGCLMRIRFPAATRSGL